MGRWSSFYGGDENGNKPSQTNLSPFLEEEEDSREMESWEYNNKTTTRKVDDDGSISDESIHDDDSADVDELSSIESSVSSLTGVGSAKARRKRRAASSEAAKEPRKSSSRNKEKKERKSERKPRKEKKAGTNKTILSIEEEKVEMKDVEHGAKDPLVAPAADAAPPKKSARFAGVGQRFKSMTGKFSFGSEDATAVGLKKSRSARNSQRRVYYFWGALALIVFIAIIAGSIVISQRRNSSDSNESKENTPPMESDAEVPMTNREQSLMDVFESVSDAGLDVEDSPQYKAKEWMFNEDWLKLTPSATVTAQRIAQRYALAVFYFSTNGPETWTTNTWLDGDECANMFWTGISCNEDNEVRAMAFGK